MENEVLTWIGVCVAAVIAFGLYLSTDSSGTAGADRDDPPED